MAATRLDRVGDGSTTVYDVTFSLGYMRKEFVYVYLNSSEYTNQLPYTWLNSTQIELTAPLPVGTEFSIRRVVVRDKPVNDYESGAILRENNLDDSFLQHLMIQEELADGYFVLTGDFVVQSTLDMLGNRIANVGNAVSPQDVLPLGQADERFVNVTGDTLTGPLAGIRAVADNQFTTLSQLAEIVDERITAVTITSPDFVDFGLITEIVADTDDYGSI